MLVRRRAVRRSLLVLLAAVVALWLAVTLAAGAYVLATDGGRATGSAPSGHDVRTGDLTTHYEQWGTTGSPVVLVPGFAETASAWRLVGPLLAAGGHRVYAIDVRGYGYTQHRGPYTLPADTTQLLGFLSALRLSRAVLVGHSSGAAIVGNLARLHPDAVSAVVFVDGDGTPYGVGPGWVHRLLVDPYLTAAIRVVVRHPSLAARVYRDACGPGCPPFDPREWLGPLRDPAGERAFAEVLRQPLIGMTYAQERQIRTRAAVVYGSGDPQMSASSAAATARRLGTTTVVAIPNARHLVMLSNPEQLARVLARLSPGLPRHAAESAARGG